MSKPHHRIPCSEIERRIARLKAAAALIESGDLAAGVSPEFLKGTAAQLAHLRDHTYPAREIEAAKTAIERETKRPTA